MVLKRGMLAAKPENVDQVAVVVNSGDDDPWTLSSRRLRPQGAMGPVYLDGFSEAFLAK